MTTRSTDAVERPAEGRRPTRRLVVVLLMAVLLALAVSSYRRHADLKMEAEGALRAAAEEQAARGAEEIGSELTSLEREAAELARAAGEMIAAGEVNLEARLEAALVDRCRRHGEAVLDFGLALVPYTLTDERRLYGPYCQPGTEEPTLHRVDFDYTEPSNHWYHEAVVRGAHWVGPYRSERHGRYVVRHGAAVFEPGSSGDETPEAVGVATVTVSLPRMQKLLTALSTGQTGYAFILSSLGRYIAHPVEELFATERSIWEEATAQGAEFDLDRLSRAVSGEALTLEARSRGTGQSGWIAFRPIGDTGWTLGVMSIAAESGVNVEERRRQLINASIALLAAALLMFRLVIGSRWSGTGGRWGFFVAASVVLVVEIGFIWRLASETEATTGPHRALIVDRAGLNQYLQRPETRDLERLPTGIQVRTLEFPSPDSVRWTGYVWQRFSGRPEGPDELGFEPEFHLPQALGTPEVKEVWRRGVDGATEVGWYVSARLRQNFEYERYPLDSKEVGLRLRHADFDSGTILVPDVSSYPMLNPSRRPAVAADLRLPGWEIRKSFFSMAVSDAGAVASGREPPMAGDAPTGDLTPALSRLPELQLSLVTHRLLLGPFISSLLPLIVILNILFALLMIVSSAHGFQISRLVGGTAGLFFAVLLAQIRMREALATTGLVYLEYFYFVVYLVLVLNLVNGVLFSAGTSIRFIREQDNLKPKLYYWPFILGIFLAITVVFFY